MKKLTGKYKETNHKDNEDELLELWWVQGPKSGLKRIHVKPSTGRIRYSKKGKELAIALPWHTPDIFYDRKSADDELNKQLAAYSRSSLFNAMDNLADARKYLTLTNGDLEKRNKITECMLIIDKMIKE